MKKLPALFLAVMLIANGLFTVSMAESEKTPAKEATESVKPAVESVKPLLGKDALEKVVGLVKTRIDIPSDFTVFNSDVYDNIGKTMFRLRWSTENSYYSGNSGSMEVTVDENGGITAYNQYRYDRNYNYQRRLPAISNEQALDSARKFIGSMCPEIIGQVAFDKEGGNYNIEYDGSYTFGFSRRVDGIPYSDNNISIQVNGQTGNIIYFNRIWSDSLIFPDADGAMSMDKAKAAYRKETGLRLVYRGIYKEDGNRSFLEYLPEISDIANGIDAFTGEKVTGNSSYYPYYSMGYRPDMYASQINLPDKDLNELKQLEGLISAESAEKLAKSMTETGIDDTYRLNSYSYGKYSNSSDYTITLQFMKPPSKEGFGKDIPEEKLKVMLAAGEGGSSASMTLNAKTSELISFNSYGQYGNNTEKTVFTRVDMQKTAERFLKKYKAEKFSQAELASNSGMVNDYMMKYGMAGPDSPNSFNYVRKVNGIPFEDNRISINFDMASGKIVSYNEVWDNMEFASSAGVISLDSAYDILLDKSAFGLRYITDIKTGNAKLAYAPDPVKPLCIDAKKGILLNYQNGEPYKEKSKPKYSDLENHSAKLPIEAVAAIGILPAAESFKPDEIMLQKDYLYFISRLRGSYAPEMSAGVLTQMEQDGMYRALINDGIFDEGEKAPDDAVTKEDAVKYLLRSAGYGKFAEMKGLFSCDFSDKADINPKLLGYAAIAKSLGLVNGGSFEPGKRLTRAEAAILLYDYLKM